MTYFAHKHYIPKGFYRCNSLDFYGEKFGDDAVDHKMDLNITPNMIFWVLLKYPNTTGFQREQPIHLHSKWRKW